MNGSRTIPFKIEKAERKTTIDLAASSQQVGDTFLAELSSDFKKDAQVEWKVVEGDDICDFVVNGDALELAATGTGIIKLQAVIKENDNYKEYTTPAKNITIEAAGADMFSFEGLGSYIYTGEAIEPD